MRPSSVSFRPALGSRLSALGSVDDEWRRRGEDAAVNNLRTCEAHTFQRVHHERNSDTYSHKTKYKTIYLYPKEPRVRHFFFKKSMARDLARDFPSFELRAIAREVAFGALASAPARVRSRSVARRIVGQLAREFERARGSGVGRARGERRREANERFARRGHYCLREREDANRGERLGEVRVRGGCFFESLLVVG